MQELLYSTYTVLLGEPRAASTLVAAPNVSLSEFWLAAPDTVAFTVRSAAVAGFVALESSLTAADGVTPAGYFSTNLFMQVAPKKTLVGSPVECVCKCKTLACHSGLQGAVGRRGGFAALPSGLAAPRGCFSTNPLHACGAHGS